MLGSSGLDVSGVGAREDVASSYVGIGRFSYLKGFSSGMMPRGGLYVAPADVIPVVDADIAVGMFKKGHMSPASPLDIYTLMGL